MATKAVPQDPEEGESRTKTSKGKCDDPKKKEERQEEVQQDPEGKEPEEDPVEKVMRPKNYCIITPTVSPSERSPPKKQMRKGATNKDQEVKRTAKKEEVHHDPEAKGTATKEPRREDLKKTSDIVNMNQKKTTGTMKMQLLQDQGGKGKVHHDPEADRSQIMTPERLWSTKVTKRLFTIGRESNDEDQYTGKVLKAKKTIEERLRKESREKKMEELRSRIIVTPKVKRERQTDGDWERVTLPLIAPEDSASRSQGDSLTPRRLTQTPLSSFMIPQTLEERRAALNKRENQLNKSRQMSSSFASPALRTRSRKMTGVRKMTEEGGEDKKKGEKFTKIKNYFEEKARSSNSSSDEELPHNNTTMCNLKCTMICSRGVQSAQRGEKKKGSHFEAEKDPEEF